MVLRSLDGGARMSVEMSLFLKRSRLATPADWARAIRSSGFDVDLDPAFDPETFSGFLPCRYRGADAGFEYSCHPVDPTELPDHVTIRLGDRDTVVSFVTHTDLCELATSQIASGVLCAISDGLLWETEGDALVSSAQALEWAKASEGEVLAALGKARPRRR
jgi:hypothetical protein